VKMFDADKTRTIGLPYGEKTYDDMLRHFHPNPESHESRKSRTDRQTDRQTDDRRTDRQSCYISIACQN